MQWDAFESIINIKWLLSRRCMPWRYDPDVPLRFVRGVARVCGPLDSCHRMMHTELCSWELGPSDRLRFAVSKQKEQKNFHEQSTGAHEYLSLPGVSTLRIDWTCGIFFYFILPSKTTLHGKRRLSGYFRRLSSYFRRLSGYFLAMWHMKNYSQDLQLTLALVFVITFSSS